MKKLLIVLVLFAMVFMAGCLPSWLPSAEPEPEVVVNAILEGGEVDWSIENISESHIYDYSLTFTVSYAEVETEVGITQWTEVVSGVDLYPGDIDYGTLELPEVVGWVPESLVTVLATY